MQQRVLVLDPREGASRLNQSPIEGTLNFACQNPVSRQSAQVYSAVDAAFSDCSPAMSALIIGSKMITLILLLLVHFAVHICARDEGLQTSTSIVSPTDTISVDRTRAAAAHKDKAYLYAGSYYFTAFAFRRDSPIHLQPVTARNFGFWLGGSTASYCPEIVAEHGDCDPGNYTAFTECTMATTVPGGQYSYSNADGSIAYTIPHSSSVPTWKGATVCPFQYTGPSRYTEGSNHGVLTPRASNAAGFMACPTAEREWKILLTLDNATVPTGNIQDCLPFGLLTLPAGNVSAAWEYI